MTRTTRLGSVAVLATVLTTTALVTTASASGGGGCGGPVTEVTGTRIRIDRFCFKPTILRAPVGAPVRWVNRDAATHVVGGANMAWGSFEQLRSGDAVAYRFSEPGVYPYVCSWHPGMIGAVVVGEGAPRFDGARLGTTSVVPADPPGIPRRADPAAVIGRVETAGPWKALGVIALGLFALTLAAGLEVLGRLERKR